MMRLLFASTAGAGHFSPLLPWIDGALQRGHEVLVVGPPELAERAPSRYPFRAGGSPDPVEVHAITRRLVASTHEEAGPLMIGEVFARLNSGALLPALRETLEEWRPDLVLRDPTEFASAVAASIAGVRHCRIGHGLAAGEQSMLDHAGPVLEEFHAGTTRSIVGSPYLTQFPEEVDPSPFPTTIRYRNSPGPLGDNLSLADWWGDGSAPLVYMTFGTVGPKMPQMLDVYRKALAAASGLKAKVLMTVGTDLRIGDLGELPPNVHVEPWVTQDLVMSQTAVVLSHGGSGTTLGALAAGCPHVVFPLFADQGANARCVAEAGVGLALMDDTPGGPAAIRSARDGDEVRMRSAIEQVLSNATYAAHAARVASSMAALPIGDEVAAALIPPH